MLLNLRRSFIRLFIRKWHSTASQTDRWREWRTLRLLLLLPLTECLLGGRSRDQRDGISLYSIMLHQHPMNGPDRIRSSGQFVKATATGICPHPSPLVTSSRGIEVMFANKDLELQGKPSKECLNSHFSISSLPQATSSWNQYYFSIPP